ncbi:hypothetical protein EJ05DRAFT_504325 [Pseudovirgaria hyperparasitica]|uniref:Ubiquitin-conjugating enzyme E2-binding protein n=1 Tax=Pseudovirgaria hyperparasitica TaxID=470096 RepID=A0A6A6VVM7_9PEZI|nr:uncharacterized protein EJ05DRAFT_504325 [Pseudovirgaria hyperparasitica]KAF2754225.1 hypothetical protein EJ05DRAFT_504325 [Pseudovirgaria hyperparasitica]
MTSEPIVQLYAEHLLNIRTLTLTASLSTESTPLTKAKISADATTLTLSHEEVSATIHLPKAIEGGANAVLELPKQATKDLQLRLMLEEHNHRSHLIKDSPAKNGALQEDNWVPWSAPSLVRRRGKFSCRNCGTAVLNNSPSSGSVKSIAPPEDTITLWKDLPNENWAEMMDFWHCHKPDTEDGIHDEAVHTKGYAAGSKIQAIGGMGFVDIAYFLLASDDCRSIKTKPDNTLHCKQCAAEVGMVDERADGYRVWKWALSYMPFDTNLPPGNHAIVKWISALFLFTIENQGVRKIAVHDTANTSMSGLLLWIFTPDLTFSSSYQPPNSERLDPTRAMKVFWQDFVTQTGEDVESTSVEEVRIPSRLYVELQGALEESKNILPVKSQVFRGWNVALLPRFQGNEID